MSDPREITESFRLERVLKSSRSGIVLRAVDPATHAPVAIKLIPCGSPVELTAYQQRFVRAMETLATRRPHAFPALLDHGFTPDASAFMVMEFVEGTRFDALGQIGARRIVELLLGVVDGLEALAESGVAHGNLAPENLFAVTTDGKESIKLLGFGTAAYGPHAEAAGSKEAAGAAPEYRAPERIESPGLEPDWRGDLYSLARIMVTALGGEIRAVDPARASVTLPAAAAADLVDAATLQATLERPLRHDPHERPASWDEFRQALRRAVTEEVAAGEKAALIDSDDLELEDAPAWLAGPAVEASPQPGAAPVAPSPGLPAARLEDTNPVLIAPVSATTTAPVQRPEPPEPWLDDGSTQRINLAERMKLIDHAGIETPAGAAPIEQESVPAPASAIQGTGREPVSGDLGGPPADRDDTIPTGRDVPPPSTAQPAELPAAAAPSTVTTVSPDAQVPSEVPPAPLQSQEVVETAARTVVAHPRRGGTGRVWLWAAGIAAVVLAASGAAVLWLTQEPHPTVARVAPPPTRAPATPAPIRAAAAPVRSVLQMQTAEHALSVGDWAAAGEALDAITPVEQAQLAPRDVERLRGLRESTDSLRRGTLARDLREAIQSSNLRLLRDTAKGLTREDEETFARDSNLAPTLEETKRALNLQTVMLKAQRDGNWPEVLQDATTLLTILPRDSQANELREKAARGLEQEADGLAQKGRYDQALARLDMLGQLWSDRSGLSARADRIRAEQAADAKVASLLASADQSERDKAPEKGLELLAGTTPGPRFEQRFRQTRERLEHQLAELDAAPPSVEMLTVDSKLEYQKGKPAALSFRVTDDHAVKSVRLFARVEGTDRWVELPMKHAANGDWTAEISATFHQNSTVDLYVTAADYSNHVGQFGTAQAPVKLKRKRNWLGL